MSSRRSRVISGHSRLSLSPSELRSCALLPLAHPILSVGSIPVMPEESPLRVLFERVELQRPATQQTTRGGLVQSVRICWCVLPNHATPSAIH